MRLPTCMALVWLSLKFIRGLKNAISAYVRTPYQTAFQITALALGLSLITVLAVLRTDLLERWQQQIPAGNKSLMQKDLVHPNAKAQSILLNLAYPYVKGAL
jgi:predicted lysophospholipase L1 biosynthesis ABC-type transport system permease subunit